LKSADVIAVDVFSACTTTPGEFAASAAKPGTAAMSVTACDDANVTVSVEATFPGTSTCSVPLNVSAPSPLPPATMSVPVSVPDVPSGFRNSPPGRATTVIVCDGDPVSSVMLPCADKSPTWIGLPFDRIVRFPGTPTASANTDNRCPCSIVNAPVSICKSPPAYEIVATGTLAGVAPPSDAPKCTEFA
jgi:hypothetical protein